MTKIRKHSISRKNLFIGFVALVLISLVFLAGTILQNNAVNEAQSKKASQFPWLANRLFTPQNDDMIINFTQLRETMNDYYNEQKIPLGVYFEYLPTGASVGVKDQLQVEIGSLAKVPAVMGIYKEIEKGNLKLEDILTVKEENLDDRFGDLWKEGAGKQLTVEEAVEYTLKQSDNTAASVLTSSLTSETLEEVFNELDLPKTRTGPFPVMSPKSYASVFRNLFLSAYLNNESSNAILGELTETNFNDKLPGGVPDNVKVAHKIGVFRIADTQDIYSDCGIIYVPNRPYILCVMVAAPEAVAREEIIAYSKMVYSFVSQVKPSKSVTEKQ
ncbi:serine hydrolase [Candidatus Saccharibacteria bacterium]|nr:serine hydrolase [Candidatus Saccharibacteria bacterium]